MAELVQVRVLGPLTSVEYGQVLGLVNGFRESLRGICWSGVPPMVFDTLCTNWERDLGRALRAVLLETIGLERLLPLGGGEVPKEG